MDRESQRAIAHAPTINRRSALAFVIGCCIPVALKLVGVTFLGELGLLLVAVWVVLTRMGNRRFWGGLAIRFIVLLCLVLLSYVVSDLFRQTAAEDAARGWSKIAFIITDFIGLYYLIRKNPSAILTFFLGYQLAALGLAAYLYSTLTFDFETYWKFWVSMPLTVVSLCTLAMLGRKGVRLSALVLIVLGAVHVILDFRSLGLMCFVIAAILLATRRTEGGRLKVSRTIMIPSALACGVLLGYLYYAGQAEHGERRQASNAWRLGTSMALLNGIMRSPVIGSGSWSSDSQMEAWRDDAMEARGVNRYAAGRFDRFTGHSEVLQAWYEGGILTTCFFFYYGFQLASTFKRLVTRRIDRLSALLLLILLNASWGFIFNPLNGLVRLDIAAALTLICFLRAEGQLARTGRAFPDAGVLNAQPAPAALLPAQ